MIMILPTLHSALAMSAQPKTKPYAAKEAIFRSKIVSRLELD